METYEYREWRRDQAECSRESDESWSSVDSSDDEGDRRDSRLGRRGTEAVSMQVTCDPWDRSRPDPKMERWQRPATYMPSMTDAKRSAMPWSPSRRSSNEAASSLAGPSVRCLEESND